MYWLTYFYEESVYINLGTWLSLGDIQINYGLLLDSLSMTVMVPVGIVTLAVLFYAIDYMRHDPNRNRFYVILSVFAIFMTVLVVSENYLMMFIGWEFVGVISYLLISFWNTRIAAMKSALSAILLNRMGDTLFVICLAFMLNLFHAVDFYTIELLTPHTDTFILNLLAIMLLIAATAKSAQLGLHGWLLSAMEGLFWALFKFHYMNEHPYVIWSSSLINKDSEKSKLSLFNKIKYGQYSGNHYFSSLSNNYKDEMRSSETTRETFYSNYDFIYWFIGFAEGDGTFIINKNNKYLEFKITQSSNDAQILFYIKKQLSFGSVKKQDKNNKTHHFRVRDKEGLLKIINIFNGNIYLNKNKIKFIKFVNRYNETYNTNIKILENNNLPTLNNAWLAGFTDTEGCFTMGLNNKNTNLNINYITLDNKPPKKIYISMRYIISQKDEDIFLNSLANLLKGKLYKLKCNTTNLVVNYTNLNIIIKYINKYSLKTKKLIIYKNWLDVYYRKKNKEHLTNWNLIYKKINKKYKI